MFPLKGGGVRLKVNQVMVPSSKKGFLQHADACSMSPGQGFVFGFQLPFDGQGAQSSPVQKVVHFNSQPNDQPQP